LFLTKEVKYPLTLTVVQFNQLSIIAGQTEKGESLEYISVLKDIRTKIAPATKAFRHAIASLDVKVKAAEATRASKPQEWVNTLEALGEQRTKLADTKGREVKVLSFTEGEIDIFKEKFFSPEQKFHTSDRAMENVLAMKHALETAEPSVVTPDGKPALN
jgi:hypothetical protein